MEMSGATTVFLEPAVTHGPAITISLALLLGFGHVWVPLGHSVL
jgi:hypothetical protein